LLREHGAAEARVGQTREFGGNELSAMTLRVDYLTNRLSKARGGDRAFSMMCEPNVKELSDLATVWIAGFDRVNPFDRIADA
jgi:hypothetical protein